MIDRMIGRESCPCDRLSGSWRGVMVKESILDLEIAE